MDLANISEKLRPPARHVLRWLAAGLPLLVCLILSPKKSAWVDEIYALLLLGDTNFHRVWDATHAGVDGGLPLYYVLAWLWGSLFGRTLLAFRMFTAAGFSLATLVLWRTLARQYSSLAVAIGLLAIVFNSWLVLFQCAEVRFYGLYSLAAVGVMAAQSRLQREDWKVFDGILVFLAHVFLVSSHALGILYSGASLLGLVAHDKHRGKFRFNIYACIAASWLALLPMLPVLHRISDIGKPHNWMLPPDLRAVVRFYGFTSLSFVFTMMIVFAILLYSRLATRWTPFPMPLFVAFSWLLLPIAVAIESQFGTILFVDRYFIPTIFAAGVLVAALLDGFGLCSRALTVTTGALWGSLTAFLFAYPVLHSYSLPSGDPSLTIPYEQLGRQLAQQVPSYLPVVVEDANTFLPLTFYRRERDPQYYYPLDWDAALGSESLHATVQYKLLRNWKNAGYLVDNILTSRQIACDFSRFVVLDSPGLSWLRIRIQNNPDFQVQPILSLSGFGDPGPNEALLVTRTTPNTCDSANSQNK